MTEEPGELYSPWGLKESDTTEQLSSYARTGQVTTVASKVQVTFYD